MNSFLRPTSLLTTLPISLLFFTMYSSEVSSKEIRTSIIHQFESTAADRVVTARKRCDSTIRQLYKNAGFSDSPEEIFLRAFKHERELEVWGRNGKEPFRLIATYRTTCPSGTLGPKRIQGDNQIPEGFYEVNRFNPKSQFHLSIGLNYPNAWDRILSDPHRPGGDIFIHGNALSIGCLPLGDDRIEEVYLMAFDSSVRPLRVHIFPARMSGTRWDDLLLQHPELSAFWRQLQPGYTLFEKTRQLPEVKIAKNGRYIVRPQTDR